MRPIARTAPLARITAIVGTAIVALLANAVYRGPLATLVTGWEWPDRPHGWLVQLVAWCVVLVPAAVLPLDAARPSRVLTWALHLGVLLPTAIVGQWAPLTDAQVVAMLLSMTAGFTLIVGVGALPALRLPALALAPRAWLAAVLFGTVLVVAWLALTWRGQLHVALPSEVYVQRAAWMARDVGLAAGYAQSWLMHAIVPALVAYACATRRWWLGGVALAAAVFGYAIGAQRIALAAPVLALVAWWIVQRAPRRLVLVALAGTVAAFAMPFVLSAASPVAATVAELVLYRGVLNNGYLATLYFDFFAARPPVGFAAVKGLALLGGDPAMRDYKAQLGWHWFGMDTDPNASFLADGFAQLGLAGILIESLMVAVALWLLDSIVSTRRVPPALALAVMAAHVVTLTNGQAPNLLLGGGVLVSLLLVWTMPLPDARKSEVQP